jgi:hypothetical protein
VSIRSTVANGRALATQLMTDYAEVHRPSSAPVLNEATGALTPPSATLVHEGPCRVRVAGDQNEGRMVFGERQLTTIRHAIWFPTDAPELYIGDLITVYPSGDRQLATRPLRVLSVSAQSHLHYREVSVQFDQ